MTRNNNDRLGIEPSVPQESDPVVQSVNQGKSELAYTQPTELVDLPTKGKFYPNTHPLHNVESVEIRYMTAKDEEILNSRTLLQKGVALDKMIQGLLTNKTIKLDEMFIGDKNALVLAARITGYDAEYKTNVTCTACGEKSTHEFDLNEARKIKEVEEGVQIAEDGTFDLVLPKSKAKVTIKLLTGNDEKSLRMTAEKKKKHNLLESAITDQLKQIIVSVNGDADGEVINQFVNNMLARDSRYIRDEYAKISPNVDLKQDFECPKCYSHSQINIPFTADFFWPNR